MADVDLINRDPNNINSHLSVSFFSAYILKNDMFLILLFMVFKININRMFKNII